MAVNGSGFAGRGLGLVISINAGRLRRVTAALARIITRDTCCRLHALTRIELQSYKIFSSLMFGFDGKTE